MRTRNLPILILAVTFVATWWPPSLVRAAEPIAPAWVASCPANTVPAEGQAWWHPTFGHVHVAGCTPYKQTLSGVYTATIYVVLHDNPGTIQRAGIMVGDPGMNGGGVEVYATPNATCPAPGNCYFEYTVSANTALYNWDGWNTIRFLVWVLEPDGNTLLASLHIPVQLANGKPVKHWGGATQRGTHDFIAGRSWYVNLPSGSSQGYTIPNVFAPRTAEQTVNTSLAYKFDSWNQDRRQIVNTQVKLDATHDAPGTVLHNVNFGYTSIRTLTVNTAGLANGWHSILVRSESRGFTSQHFPPPAENLVAVTKYWFRVQH